MEHPCQPRAIEARQACRWCQQEHDTQPQYWNRKPRPASRYAMRREVPNRKQKPMMEHQ